MKGGSDPRCWWCGEPIPLDNEWRAQVPELGLPFPSGVHVCGPSCPKQPDGAFVYPKDAQFSVEEVWT